MKSEDDNMELEKEAPILAAISKENTFNTPDGYFSNLTEQILAQANLNELIAEETSFNVPNNYFENLEQQIRSAVYLDELKEVDSKGHGFEIPANYFSESKKLIQNSISSPNSTKVLKLHFIRYAAAACILFTTTLGAYFNVKHNTAVAHQLSKIPALEIETYLNQHTDNSDLPMLIENIDDDANLSIDDFQLEKTIN